MKVGVLLFLLVGGPMRNFADGFYVCTYLILSHVCTYLIRARLMGQPASKPARQPAFLALFLGQSNQIESNQIRSNQNHDMVDCFDRDRGGLFRFSVWMTLFPIPIPSTF